MALIWNTGAQSFSKKRANPMLWFTPFLRKIIVNKSGCKEIFDIMHLCNPVTLQLKQWSNGSRYNATGWHLVIVLVTIQQLLIWLFRHCTKGYKETATGGHSVNILVTIQPLMWWPFSHTNKGLFTYDVRQKKGGPDHPYPPCNTKIRYYSIWGPTSQCPKVTFKLLALISIWVTIVTVSPVY